LALLNGDPRAANVKARTDVVCVTMDRHSVKRMFGPLDEILKRNMDLYVKYKK
jgi:cAMP-dependent protein kinase regulator